MVNVIRNGNLSATYGTRQMGNGFGIIVSLYRNGKWETTDMNQMPWPTQAMALERAREAATTLVAQEAA